MEWSVGGGGGGGGLVFLTFVRRDSRRKTSFRDPKK